VYNKVGKLRTELKVQVLDESTSRDRDADRRRQFWCGDRSPSPRPPLCERRRVH